MSVVSKTKIIALSALFALLFIVLKLFKSIFFLTMAVVDLFSLPVSIFIVVFLAINNIKISFEKATKLFWFVIYPLGIINLIAFLRAVLK